MTFYFYDLETSSGSPRDGRVMQFAGQRTDEDLNPIGEPDNILVKLSDDILPEPDAVLVHKITPQKTLEEGITEAEFAKYFNEKIANGDTVFVGFNNIRFDDEFMRRVCYRNFYDPYQWHWKNGNARWDLLDPIRMMRALRPEGMKWPFIDGKPTVKLELMAKENDVMHENAHDALSDVLALIELAKKYKTSQPKLFSYLLEMRDKKKVANLVLNDGIFVYSSGKYSSEHEKTSVVQTLFKHPRRDAAIVFDLTKDPNDWVNKDPKEILKHWTAKYGDDIERLPVKTIQFNKCPAVAPLGVLDGETQKRINLDLDEIQKNRKVLLENTQFVEALKEALDILENEQQSRMDFKDDVDNQIYEGFWNDSDANELSKVRGEKPEKLSELVAKIKNKRIREQIPLYKARNFPELLSAEEKEFWEEFRRKKLTSGSKSKFSRFGMRLQELYKGKLTSDQEFLLTELQLYAETIMPDVEDLDQSD